METEFKLLASAPLSAQAVERVLASLGVEIEARPAVSQHDVYLDSAHGDVAACGAGLRLRRHNGEQILCWKDAGRRSGDRFDRIEVELPWPSADLPTSAAALPEDLRRHVEPRIFGRVLQPVVTLRTERRRYRLQRPAVSEAGSAELVLDEVHLDPAAHATPPLCELELEVEASDAGAWQEVVAGLQRDLGLAPAPASKLAAALERAGVPTPAGLPTRIRPKTPLVQAGLRTFSRLFNEGQRHEAGTRLGDDPEALHQMRVANRRLGAAFRTFAPVFGRAALQPHRRLAQRTRQALGPVRDADVLIEVVPALAEQTPLDIARGMGDVMRLLGEERARHRRRMLTWLTSATRLRGAERFQLYLEKESLRALGGLRVRDGAAGMVMLAARRAFDLGAGIDAASAPEDLHALRIAFKRLRYTLETFAPAYPGLTRARRHLVALQDALGEYNDAHVAAGWLGTWPSRRRMPAQAAVAVGALVGLQAARREVAREDFLRLWHKLDAKRMRRDLLEALF